MEALGLEATLSTMYVEKVHSNLLVVNLSLLRLEDIGSWIKKTMPHVQHIAFYCRTWLWMPILPPNDSNEIWRVYSSRVRNLEEHEQHNAKELAIQESDSMIPTLCFVEFLDDISQRISSNENSQEKIIPQGGQYEGPKEKID